MNTLGLGLLGNKVRCRVTGFTGIAIYMNEWLNGCIQYGLKPASLDKDGKIREAEQFDVQQLEFVDNAVTPSQSHPPKFELGNTLRDSITGFQGIAVYRVTWLNGTVSYGLRPKMDNDGKIRDVASFDDFQLTYVDDGIAVTKKPTGGDMGMISESKERINERRIV